MGFSIRLPRREGEGGSMYFTFPYRGSHFYFHNPIYFHNPKARAYTKKRGAPYAKKDPLNGLFKLDAKACALLKAQIG